MSTQKPPHTTAADALPDDWTPAEVYEAREHGVDKITRADGKEWWS